jgi:hypothetical protein
VTAELLIRIGDWIAIGVLVVGALGVWWTLRAASLKEKAKRHEDGIDSTSLKGG